MAINTDSVSDTLTPSTGTVNISGYTNTLNTFGFKNRIINGAMVIDQRNAGASVTPTDGQYLIDRFTARQNVASKFSAQQSTTAPAVFINSLLVTSLSAYSVAATDIFAIRQKIEGLNVSDLAWGTASAATVTLSFWVRSSLTGTFGGSLMNSSQARAYPFTYTINSANTWEQKSVTIAGDTSGTWLTTNGVGIELSFGLGVGSTYSGSAGSWAGATYYAPTGATSVVGTSGATFYITGVQLEKGSTATSFDFRDYGTELALCQRYLPMVTNSGNSTLGVFGNGSAPNTTAVDIVIPFLVTPRVPPTGLTITGAASNYRVSDNANSLTPSAITFTSSSNMMAYIEFTVTGATTFRPYIAYIVSSATEYKLYFTGCEL